MKSCGQRKKMNVWNAGKHFILIDICDCNNKSANRYKQLKSAPWQAVISKWTWSYKSAFTSMLSVVRHWHREVVDLPSLKVFESMLDRIVNSLLQGKVSRGTCSRRRCPCPWQRVERDHLLCLSKPRPFYDHFICRTLCSKGKPPMEQRRDISEHPLLWEGCWIKTHCWSKVHGGGCFHLSPGIIQFLYWALCDQFGSVPICWPNILL